jgi:hypothetical protein
MSFKAGEDLLIRDIKIETWKEYIKYQILHVSLANAGFLIAMIIISSTVQSTLDQQQQQNVQAQILINQVVIATNQANEALLQSKVLSSNLTNEYQNYQDKLYLSYTSGLNLYNSINYLGSLSNLILMNDSQNQINESISVFNQNITTLSNQISSINIQIKNQILSLTNSLNQNITTINNQINLANTLLTNNISSVNTQLSFQYESLNNQMITIYPGINNLLNEFNGIPNGVTNNYFYKVGFGSSIICQLWQPTNAGWTTFEITSIIGFGSGSTYNNQATNAGSFMYTDTTTGQTQYYWYSGGSKGSFYKNSHAPTSATDGDIIYRGIKMSFNGAYGMVCYDGYAT